MKIDRREKRRASLERRIAYWEERVEKEPALKPQLEHHRAQLQRFTDRLEGSEGHDWT